MKRDHISNYLNFKPSPRSKGFTYDHQDVAIVSSGSEIYRNEKKRCRSFQLFLNEKEYEGLYKIREKFQSAHFYGGNYIYLPPHSNSIIDIAKHFNWTNTI